MPDSGPTSPTPTAPSRKAVFQARLLSTVVLWGVVTAGVVLQWNWLFFLLISGLGILALIELMRMQGLHEGGRRYFFWTVFVSVAYLAATFHHCLTEPLQTRVLFSHLDVFFFVAHLFGLFSLALLSPLEGRKTSDHLFGAFFAFGYVIFLFNFLTRILYLPESSGVIYALYLLVVTKFTDMGAYVLGSLVGKHKMIPHISPGKTWEGLIGAYLAASLGSFALFFAFRGQLVHLTFMHAALLPLLLGTGAVIGDLAESVIKRCLGSKDSGHMLPGIGGALDLIDSLCFTAPLLYLYMHYILGMPGPQA